MSAPIDLNLLRAFVAVHETGRFSAAADQLGVPRSTISRAVAALEEATGTLLFQRTTRTVTCTAAGNALFDRIAPALGSLAAALSDLPESTKEPTGVLRVTATPDMAAVLLSEVAVRYAARYPTMKVHFVLTQRLVNLAKENIDVAVRITNSKRMRDSSMVVRKIGEIVIQLYASPSYIARRGAPTTPADLDAHDWTGHRETKPRSLSYGMKMVRVTAALTSRITCDDISMAHELIRAGGGIGWLPSFHAEADVAAGRLVRVLPRWYAPSGNVHLVHPSRRHVPARVTAFGDLLLETLRQRPLPGR
jgi:DNA-binding transcriptional LysR family regulator